MDEGTIERTESEATTATVASAKKPRARKAKAAKVSDEQTARTRLHAFELDALQAIGAAEEMTPGELAEAMTIKESEAERACESMARRGVLRVSRESVATASFPRAVWYVVAGDEEARLLTVLGKGHEATASWLAEEAVVETEHAQAILQHLWEDDRLTADCSVEGEPMYALKAAAKGETQELPPETQEFPAETQELPPKAKRARKAKAPEQTPPATPVVVEPVAEQPGPDGSVVDAEAEAREGQRQGPQGFIAEAVRRAIDNAGRPLTLDEIADLTECSKASLRKVIGRMLERGAVHQRTPVEPGPVLFALGAAPAEPARPAASDVDDLADWLCTEAGQVAVPHRLAPAGARAVLKYLEGEQRRLAWVASHPKEIEALLVSKGFRDTTAATYANNTVRAARCRISDQVAATRAQMGADPARLALDELQPVLQAAGEVGRELMALREKVAVLDGHLAQLFAFATAAKAVER